ncbi:MAG: MATE family efflux transporter [Lachnospiraceae bacterium]|nr:MATE family efflux transporter [Lachnospiraceae bacterium]
MDIKQIKENKLKMILQFSIPSIIAMLLQTVITITDGYFTGNYVGQEALAAINLGLPILYFYLGAGLCIGVGGSVISGRLLGSKKRKKSSEVFSQSIVTAAILCVIISVVVFLLFTPILKVLRADGMLSDYFTDYYRIMLFTYPIMVISTILGMFIRTDGKPQVCMLVNIVGCILNAILDYILVGMLGYGVSGSAVASLFVQVLSVLIQLCFFLNQKAGIRFCRFTCDKAVNKEILLNGSSEFIGEMASAISMFAFNYVLMKYVGAEGVAAFTILGFVVYGYSMVCIGFGQGICPLISICWGAKETETAINIRKITNNILFVTGLVIAGIFFVTGKSYAGAFGCNDSIANMVGSGFRIYAITFVVMGYDVINSMYFTSCGDAKSSALISSLRGLVLLLAFTFILPAFFGMNGVWFTAPCSEMLTAIVSFCLVKQQVKKLQ